MSGEYFTPFTIVGVVIVAMSVVSIIFIYMRIYFEWLDYAHGHRYADESEYRITQLRANVSYCGVGMLLGIIITIFGYVIAA